MKNTTFLPRAYHLVIVILLRHQYQPEGEPFSCVLCLYPPWWGETLGEGRHMLRLLTRAGPLLRRAAWARGRANNATRRMRPHTTDAACDHPGASKMI